MIKQKLKIGFDCDDVLFVCNQFALDKFNEKNGTHYCIEDIKGWCQEDATFEFRKQCYKDPDFVYAQPLFPGAKEFMKKICKIADVYITTAVPPECMTARAMRINEEFPWIKDDHIILGASKDLYNLDIILDDGSHNIKSSIAKYPVLMRRPWNADLSGVLAVNGYDDFLHLVHLIYESYSTPVLKDGGVICLVGPSGSGKTAIMTELTKDPAYIKPLTTTTRKKRDGEPSDAYRFVSEDLFIEEMNKGMFMETTVYSGFHYGTSATEINRIIDNNKFAVIPIDICGAIAIKNKYRKKAVLLFVNRKKENVIFEIVSRNVSPEEKTKRILSLDKEYSNRVFCDEVVENDKNLEEVCKQIKELVK